MDFREINDIEFNDLMIFNDIQWYLMTINYMYIMIFPLEFSWYLMIFNGISLGFNGILMIFDSVLLIWKLKDRICDLFWGPIWGWVFSKSGMGLFGQTLRRSLRFWDMNGFKVSCLVSLQGTGPVLARKKTNLEEHYHCTRRSLSPSID